MSASQRFVVLGEEEEVNASQNDLDLLVLGRLSS
jgi:hypothetical protein